MADFEYWLAPPVPPDLSDEAASQIADFLMDLALWFESRYADHIRRHHRANDPDPYFRVEPDDQQLELFDDLF